MNADGFEGAYYKFQSTLLMRGATRAQLGGGGVDAGISIHAPHARSDFFVEFTMDDIEFQSTLLMRGATRYPAILADGLCLFQSTLLMRGATISIDVILLLYLNISIHAPHARSDCQPLSEFYLNHISIHAPHARSDVTRGA